MLMDMRYVNERRHFCCHVMHQVLMLYVADMSSPSHVAPSLPATFDIDRRSRGNDGLDPMMRAGPARKFRFDVVWVIAALVGIAENNKPPARALIKTAIRDRICVLSLKSVTRLGVCWRHNRRVLIRHKNAHPTPCSRQSQPSCSAPWRFDRQLT